MINCIESELNFSGAPNAANAKSARIYPGFEELLVEKAVSQRTQIHGFVGDGQDLCPGLNEETIELINSLLSFTDGLENIWKIVLRLEKKVDIEAFIENIIADIDDAAGVNTAAALLTRFWKKKELLGNTVSEGSADISSYLNPEHIENRAASELDALILKSKERKFITAINSD